MRRLADAPPLHAVRSCPTCGVAERAPAMGRSDESIALVRCGECRLVYASAHFAPTYLDEDYYGHRAQPEVDPRKRTALIHYDRLSGGALARPAPGARALDMGCNTGGLLDELRSWGYATEGVERCPAAARVAARRHRVHNIDLSVPSFELGRRFRAITMTHVLEHVPRPVDALRFMHRHLEGTGVGVIEVPNWSDPGRRLWGRRYRPLELGDHVSFFERRTLADAIERAGLRVRALSSAPQAATLVMPSLLTAADAVLSRSGGATVATPRARSRGMARTLRGLALKALDAMDRPLAAIAGRDAAWGANLIAVVAR